MCFSGCQEGLCVHSCPALTLGTVKTDLVTLSKPMTTRENSKNIVHKECKQTVPCTGERPTGLSRGHRLVSKSSLGQNVSALGQTGP